MWITVYKMYTVSTTMKCKQKKTKRRARYGEGKIKRETEEKERNILR